MILIGLYARRMYVRFPCEVPLWGGDDDDGVLAPP